jgi:hypothetical protein
MACRATIDYADIREPDLLNAGFEVTAKGDCVTALADKSLIASLITTPIR